MAVDTRSKRASVLGIGLVAALTLPQPDATVGQADRQHVALSYAGVAAAEDGSVAATADVTIRMRPDVSVIQCRADQEVLQV